MALYFCDLLPKTDNHSTIMRKTSDNAQSREILSNIWPVTLKMIKVIKEKESLWNFHSQDKPKET